MNNHRSSKPRTILAVAAVLAVALVATPNASAGLGGTGVPVAGIPPVPSLAIDPDDWGLIEDHGAAVDGLQAIGEAVDCSGIDTQCIFGQAGLANNNAEEHPGSGCRSTQRPWASGDGCVPCTGGTACVYVRAYVVVVTDWSYDCGAPYCQSGGAEAYGRNDVSPATNVLSGTFMGATPFGDICQSLPVGQNYCWMHASSHDGHGMEAGHDGCSDATIHMNAPNAPSDRFSRACGWT